MKVDITRITPKYPAGVYVQWDVDPDNGVSGTYIFILERSGSPEGPWRQIAGPLANTISYTEDFTVYNDDSPLDDSISDEANLKSFQREIYYRVIATAPDGVTAVSPVVDLDGTPAVAVNSPIPAVGITVETPARNYGKISPVQNTETSPRYPHRRLILFRRKILREQYILLSKLNGVAVKVLKRRYFGKRCPDCSDTLTRSTFKYTCNTCYGTGWEGGFFDSIDTFANFRPAPVSRGTGETGIIETVKTNVTMLSYPRVEIGDVIVELDTNRRWKIESSSPTELRRMILHQRLVVTELGRDSVEYLIDIGI